MVSSTGWRYVVVLDKAWFLTLHQTMIAEEVYSIFCSQKMKDAFLKADDFNVILIDWGGGSSFPYTQATANTRVVGAEIAKLIKVLQVTQKKK